MGALCRILIGALSCFVFCLFIKSSYQKGKRNQTPLTEKQGEEGDGDEQGRVGTWVRSVVS